MAVQRTRSMVRTGRYPAASVQGVAQFPHRKAGHCGSGAFRDLLEFHGLSWDAEPLSEAMVFGLSGGLGCFYYELPDMDPPLYLVGRTGGLERSVCRHLGIDLDLRRTDNGGEAWRWLRDELDAGHPTMVNADIHELDYLRVKLSNTMHDIVVTGYDQDEGVALIADNDREEIQRCSLESLARARASNGFPGPSRHATWVMRFPDRLPDPRIAVAGALRRAVANMREDGEALAGIGPGTGLDHVDLFARSYARWPELFGDRTPGALRGLWVFIVKAGTGGAMFRSLQAGFLREASELLGDARVARAAGVYEELAGEWVALADALRSEHHAAGLPHVQAIARIEREGVAAMAECA
ncbi:MAG: hypothetical protein QOF37_592 [Thermoleophilaceae bacterium]|nr:hypothetical protein [Thermoleophilaceae bacterium]